MSAAVLNGVTLDAVTVMRGARPVLDAVSCGFSPGRLTVVIGPNGAGKSTLLAVAAGLLAPASGLVRWGDAPLARLPRRTLAARRAYLPQHPRIDWPIAVAEVVALGLGPHTSAFGPLPPRWRSAVADALDRFDLAALADRPATQLSGGELARVMLARATVGDPELLIVDEPTAGLDPRHALDAGRRLRAIADEGRTVVVALHDLDLAARLADEAVAVKQGRIVAAGAADRVFTGAILSGLYDIPARVGIDGDAVTIRFAG